MKQRTIGTLLIGILAVACSGGGVAQPEWEVAHTSTHWWMSAVAVSATDQYVVGGTTTQGAILHYDGAQFSEVEQGADVGLLNWVHRFEDGSLVVAGNDGVVLRSSDGMAWSVVETPTDQDLWGVWGSSPTDMWAVGGNAMDGEPTILRDQGMGWFQVTVPDMERPGVRVFFKVWGSSADDVYIVGQHGAVLHWNGSELEELHVGISGDLIGVWGTSSDRVALVGGRGNAQAVLWDGSEWREVDLARYDGLNGVWLDGDTVHFVGNEGLTGTIDFATGEASVEIIDTPVALHAITGSATTLTAVGGDFGTGEMGPFLGQIVVAERP